MPQALTPPSTNLILGRGINGFITGIVRLEEDARFLYDPRTGQLVTMEKRGSEASSGIK